MRVLGTYKDFKKFIKKSQINPEINKAIKIYLNSGGVLKVENGLPLTIVYPNKNRLKELLKKIEGKERYLDSEINGCKKELRKMTADGIYTQITKVIRPIYWQHLIQLGIDGKYRKDFDVVNLPMEMIHIPRYKKIVEMFITNPEYRERLLEARTSELGKLRESIKESAYKADNFKKNTVKHRIKKLENEKGGYRKRKGAIQTLIGTSTRFF